MSHTFMDVALCCEMLEMIEWIFLEWALSSTGNDIGWKTIVTIELSLQLWRYSHIMRRTEKQKRSLIKATRAVRSIVHRNNIVLQSKTWIIYNQIPIQILYYLKKKMYLQIPCFVFFTFMLSGRQCCYKLLHKNDYILYLFLFFIQWVWILFKLNVILTLIWMTVA